MYIFKYICIFTYTHTFVFSLCPYFLPPFFSRSRSLCLSLSLFPSRNLFSLSLSLFPLSPSRWLSPSLYVSLFVSHSLSHARSLTHTYTLCLLLSLSITLSLPLSLALSIALSNTQFSTCTQTHIIVHISFVHCLCFLATVAPLSPLTLTSSLQGGEDS